MSDSEHSKSTGLTQPDNGLEKKGLFHKDIRIHRNNAFKKIGLTIFLVGVMVMGILSVYWGALFNVTSNLGSLVVYVVDFDGVGFPNTQATIGPALISAVQKAQKQPEGLGWQIMSPSDFNNNASQVFDAILNNQAYAAIVANANATYELNQAIATGNGKYDPQGALQMIYALGRDQTAITSYVLPQLEMLETQLIASYNLQHIQSLGSLNNLTQVIQASPTAVGTPIAFSVYNLIPFNDPVLQAPLQVGLIYLVIVSFYAFTFFAEPHSLIAGHILTSHYIIYRIFCSLFAFFWLSFFFSLVTLAFQVDFSIVYGKGGFPMYWLINFLGFCATGLPTENVGNMVGMKGLPFWLLLWVISNACTAFFPIELMAGFYKYGYAFPLFNVVQALRVVLLGVHFDIGLNVGILCAWIGLSILLMPFTIWFFRRKTRSTAKNQNQKQRERVSAEVDRRTQSPMRNFYKNDRPPSGAFAV